ncbi:hypothetical protein [Anaerosinus gibii]|uniref:Lipoprotein n=1 Tax=Selenobaculum gibii TaxID=3054208 RepID=A0A9Y2EQQ7_9FIRM|nr:hypothetical protein [Selenobaculum gbiensis]WIW70292.1 hypothetical protein P3F81_10385 [Selenobaculum gbiensis]
MKNVKRYAYLLLIPLIALLLGGCGDEKKDELKMVIKAYSKDLQCIKQSYEYVNVIGKGSFAISSDMDKRDLDQIKLFNEKIIKKIDDRLKELDNMKMPSSLKKDEQDKISSAQKEYIEMLKNCKLAFQSLEYEKEKYNELKALIRSSEIITEIKIDEAKEKNDLQKLDDLQKELSEINNKIEKLKKEVLNIREYRRHESIFELSRRAEYEYPMKKIVKIYRDNFSEDELNEIVVEIKEDFKKDDSEEYKYILELAQKINLKDEQEEVIPLDELDFSLAGIRIGSSTKNSGYVSDEYKYIKNDTIDDKDTDRKCMVYLNKEGIVYSIRLNKELYKGTPRDVNVGMDVSSIFRKYGDGYEKESKDSLDVYTYRNNKTYENGLKCILKFKVDRNSQEIKNIILEQEK